MKNFYFWMLTLLCCTLTFGQLSENFESDITERGWTLYQTGTDDPGFVISSDESYNGSSSYFHSDNNISAESTSYMVSPAYTIQSGDEFSVYVRQFYSASYYNYSGIEISTASNDPIANPGDFTEIWEAGSGFAEGTWEQVLLNIDTYVGQTVHFAFKYTGDFNHRYYVDNLYVGAACNAPEGNLTVVPNCDNNTFSVDIDVTSLGSASSVVITDQGGNTQTVNTTGVVSFGPYNSGDNVTFTLADEDSATCNTLLADTYSCPPANDNCATATSIDNLPYSATEDGTGATQTDFLSCSTESSNDGVWYTFEGESTQYTVNVTSIDWDAAITILSGSCGSFTCVDQQDIVGSNGQESVSFIGEPGVTYYINVGYYSAANDGDEGVFELEILTEDIPCEAPTNLVAENTTDLSTDLSWTAGTGNLNYEIIWGEAGFTPSGEPNVTGITTTSYSVGNLTPNTTYDFYIRGNCNPGFSDWVGPVTVTTEDAGFILAGTDCLHPIEVDALPYTTTDDTTEYGDNYDGTAGTLCGATSNYLSGNDVVYSYTAVEETSIDITLSPTGTYSGLFVYDSCENIGVACLDGYADASTVERVIENLIVPAGATYYIVISSWPQPQTVGYTLTITENTCIDGTYAATTVGDCENNQFFVDVEITDMGDLTEYVIEDDQGSAPQTATENGTYTFGPYAEGSTITYNLVANDTNCNDTFTVLFFCPAVNDECENAIDVPVNADLLCSEFVSGNTTGATESPQEDDVVGTPNNDVWFSFVASSTEHRVTLSNVVNLSGSSTTDMAMGVYDASGGCDALVFVDDSDPNTLDLSGLTVGNEYLIRVYNWSSTVYNHSFDICVGTPPPPPANDDCSGAFTIACGEIIEGDTTSSTPSGLASTCDGFTSSDAKDLFYTFEADGSSNYLISLNPTVSSFDGVLIVYSGECGSLENLDCSDSGNPEQVELLAPSAGTYYIRVFDYSGIGSFSLELTCEENTCTPGDFDIVIEGACDTNEFNVDINFNNLGSLDSYVISDDQGSSAQTVTEAGTYSFGPYASETVVTFTLEASDPNCNYTEEVTYRCAAAGDTCENPLMVDTLPYSTDDNTANYGDDYDGGQGENCGTGGQFYLGGDDVVYAYTATSDTSLNLELTTAGTYTGLFVYNSCDAIGVECAEGVINSGAGGGSIENFIVTAGETYYFVISSWPAPQSFEYNFTITENSCTGIEYVVETINQCDDQLYTVEVNVTSLGSSANLVVSDDQGGSQTITEAGTLTFGPYDIADNVEFTFTPDDVNCMETTTVSSSCPPTNDACTDATELVIGTDFESNVVTGSNVGATSYPGMPTPPGCSVYLGSEVWYTVTVPASGSFIIETRSSDLDAFDDSSLVAYTGTCDALVELDCNDDGGDGLYSLLSFENLTPGETIYFAVFSYNNANTGTFLISAYDNDMGVADYGNNSSVKLHPNPTNDYLNISGIDLKDIQVYTTSGKLVKIRISGNVVDTRGLPTGTYFIRMTDVEGNVIHSKFIKK